MMKDYSGLISQARTLVLLLPDNRSNKMYGALADALEEAQNLLEISERVIVRQRRHIEHLNGRPDDA